jgi:glyoxylase-like metal-dependent hydrolase (beta-lactamase superfamily II)
MRLRVCEQGVIEARDAVFVTEDDRRELVNATWPVRCYLIEHPKGLLLWDAGLPEGSPENPPPAGTFPKGILQPLVPWLAGLGITPADIAYAGFSHLHNDHAGNANHFAGATVVASAREWAHAFGPDPGPVYRPQDYAALRDSRAILVDGTHDLFGDGAVVIHAAPGHTPGHQILLLTVPAEERPLLLVGDAFYAPEDRTHRRVPEWNWDKPASFRSLDRIDQLAAETGARLLVHHDPNT